MTNTETTTRPFESKMTRRNMLKSMAAASTATIVMSADSGASVETDPHSGPSLKQLLESHQRAWRTFEDICGNADDLERAYKAKFARPLVPLTITPEGNSPAFYELNFDYPDEAESRIKRAHMELRAQHCSDLAKVMAPSHWAAMAEAIDRSERECMAALESAMADEEAQRTAFGLSEAKRDWELTSEAEEVALVDVMRHVPKTPAEAVEKTDYLRTWYSKGNCLEEHHFDALLEGQGVAPRN